jgi:hypothetical protein
MQRVATVQLVPTMVLMTTAVPRWMSVRLVAPAARPTATGRLLANFAFPMVARRVATA